MSDFDVTPVVWRVTAAPEGNQYTLGQLYRHADGHWQVWLTISRRWVISLAYGGLAEMLGDGYYLVPDEDPVPAVSEQEAHMPHLWTLTTGEDEKYRTDPNGRWQVWLDDEQRWAGSIHASKEAMEAIGHQFRPLDAPAEEATRDA